MRSRTLIAIAAGTILGAGAGFGAFWLAVGPLFPGEREIGGWTTVADIGGARQDPYARARVALFGIWGLPPSEAIYYTARSDAEGRPLTGDCVYSVEGRDPPGRWWSLTAYRGGFYIANPDDRYSWSSTDIGREPDGGWTMTLSAQGREGPNPLALGPGPGRIALSFRIYQPAPTVVRDRTLGVPPVVRRLACGTVAPTDRPD